MPPRQQQFAAPWTAQQTYTLTGTLNDPDEPHQTLSLVVLAGASGPIPTAGWTKVSNIDRARRKGFTMPTGYDPMAMDVPIRFDATYNYVGTTYTAGSGIGTLDYTSPDGVRTGMQILDWLAGRGKLYANGTHPAHGDPPIVQITSFRQAANRSIPTNLIPPDFHSDQPGDLRWLISNLTFDQNPLTNEKGDRILQDVTVSLVEYVATPGAPRSPRNRQTSRGHTGGFKSFTTTDAIDTIAKVCLHFGINSRRKWEAVLDFNQSRLKVTSYSKHLKRGTTVQIPKKDF